MQFRRQGTKVFYKAGTNENKNIYFAVLIHSTFVNLSKDDDYVFKYRSAG